MAHSTEEEPRTALPLDLPEQVLQHVFLLLDSRSLAKLACTCKELAQLCSAPFAWQHRCERRWKTKTTEIWTQLASRNAYKRLYGTKDELDNRATKLVSQLHDKQTFHSALLGLYHLGPDILDVLREEAVKEASQIGQPNWAREALLHVQARRASDGLCALVYRCGHSEEVCLDEGAMLLAQCHYATSDLSGVSKFFDELAAELLRRMQAAGVAGGEAALPLLSELLFAQNQQENNDDARYHRWRQPESTEIRAWGPEEEAAALRLPTDGGSLNLRGNRGAFGDPANSLIPNILLTGRGIPLTLCIIHAAVGRRAGLNIVGVNMPMHFVNKFQDGDFERYIDCFNGGRILTKAQLPSSLGPEVFLRLQLQDDKRVFSTAMPRDVWIRAISNMQNAYTGNMMSAYEQPPRGLALCNLLMCGILRTFTRIPYFVQQDLVTRYVQEVWPGENLLPWMEPGSLPLAPRGMSDSLRVAPFGQ